MVELIGCLLVEGSKGAEYFKEKEKWGGGPINEKGRTAVTAGVQEVRKIGVHQQGLDIVGVGKYTTNRGQEGGGHYRGECAVYKKNCKIKALKRP